MVAATIAVAVFGDYRKAVADAEVVGKLE